MRWAAGVGAIAVLALMIARYPHTANHELLGLVCLLLVAIDERPALRWLVPIAFGWSGIQKAISGCWFEGEFLVVSALETDRFRYLQLIVPRAEMNALRSMSTSTVGHGPFHFESTIPILISNAIWLLEIGLAISLCFAKTRRVGAILMLVLLVGIELFAREILFGVLCAALLSLFFRPAGVVRRPGLAVLGAIACWPLVQIALVRAYAVDPWELWGFGMYSRPHLDSEIRAFALPDRRLPRTDALREYEDAWRHVGRLASPRRAALAYFEADPSLVAVEFRTARLELDPETDRIRWAAMQKIRWGRTGVEVPAVSLGTWGHGGPNVAGTTSVGWSGHDDGLATEALVKAAELGITHWDTADVYGNGRAEALIGDLWKRVPRDRIFLATKVGWDPGSYGHYYDPRQMRSQLVRSLRNLRTDVVDLYYLHHCNFGQSGEYFDDALAEIKKFQEEGKIRFIGLSDWNLPKIMQYIDRVDPDVVQPYRCAKDDAWESSGLKSWIAAHDRGVAFFSPLKHGVLLGKYDRPQAFPEGDFRRNVAEFGDAAALEKIKQNRVKIEERFGRPVMHALVTALLADAPTACVLLGMRNAGQVEAAAAINSALSEEEARWVRSLYRA